MIEMLCMAKQGHHFLDESYEGTCDSPQFGC